MQKQFAFFPGKLWVVFRKGPLGFLLQEPSDEAKRVSSTPQDKSAAMREDLVRQNALAVIRQRGGDPSDKMENDVGSTVYLIKNVQSEEAAGLCMADSHSKDSLQSFVSYALSFQEIQALLTYEAGRGDGVTASSEDDQLVGFGARAKSTWKEIWDSRGDGYADFVTGRRCVPGTRMSRLQQNLLKRQQPTTSSTPAEHPMKAPAEPLAMEEDVEMEREMLSIHNSDLQVQSYAMPVAAAALPRVPPGAKTGPDSCTAQTSDGRVPPLTTLPKTKRVLHPFFIWKPESHITGLRNNDILPCLHSCPRPQVVSAAWETSSDRQSPWPVFDLFLATLLHVPGRSQGMTQAAFTRDKSLTDECVRSAVTDRYGEPERREAEAGAYGQRTIGQYVRMEDRPRAFGSYEDQEGWGGVSVSGFYLTDCLLDEFKRQQPSLTKLLQGTFGQVFRWDHTRKMARKQGMAQRYSHAGVEKAGYHWMDRFDINVQFFDQEDLKRLRDASEFCGIRPANPTKRHVREHCRTKIPQPSELLERVERVLQHFHLATDPNHVHSQAIHAEDVARSEGSILRGCLSDPELSEGIMDRDGGTLQLNHVAGEGAKVPVWIPVRGQAMTGVVRWNFQRPVDMKKPGAVLPAVFDPASMWELNSASMAVTGQDKCPAFTSLTETLEKDVSGALPLPLKSSPRSARTGPMKTGGGVFVLDHTRWTLPMKDAIDSLLQYHHGDKDILRLVDQTTQTWSIASGKAVEHQFFSEHQPREAPGDSTAVVLLDRGEQNNQRSCSHHGDGCCHSSAALPTPLTQDSIEKIVQGILEMEQQQQRPEQKMRQTKPCLACGQPKSLYGTGGSSIHFFYQQGPVRYFYCSRKVHQTYAAEGLSDPRMPFEQFAASEFFQRELEATKKRVEDKAQRQIGCV
ncbi:hypothetical protein D4764_0104310 [Takifugu flavidus]|uniref:Uncharacterized protein n=1 Tax=Takifugu flavidus TaxID=433684 RepID=A0A5C6MF46_9TELE|nr:hypothetical protein D4764_0104310 [Takifugu flavidus]